MSDLIREPSETDARGEDLDLAPASGCTAVNGAPAVGPELAKVDVPLGVRHVLVDGRQGFKDGRVSRVALRLALEINGQRQISQAAFDRDAARPTAPRQTTRGQPASA